jgi:general secretion pathway protein A
MYYAHWGLRESPFPAGNDPDFFYQGLVHEEALARLHYLVEQRRRLGLLIGPSGSGKTLLLELAARQWRRAGRCVGLSSLLAATPEEFLLSFAEQLGLNLPADSPLPVIWRAVGDRLLENRYQWLDTVLLLDDADQATVPVIGQVSRLLRHDPSSETRLTIVLAAQDGRAAVLAPLQELVELRIELAAWQREETAEFLRISLERAGRQKPLFADPAVERLHQLAQGIPRRVRQLADLALVAGAGQQLGQIDAGVIDSVYQELYASQA